SQRGGSVASHLKIGDFDGPMIRRGSADVVIGFEPNELLRALPFLSPGGLCCGAVAAPGLPDSILTALAGMGAGTVLVDARSIALDLGNANLTNVVLIGAAAGKPGFPFGYQLLEETLSRVAPKKYRELNLAALKAGRQVKG
ncbi:2-oxoacid:acceptor oxidoreductase family protein, partial [bacterium]|nr:2-oxoacid:acceptor oxidoreductase family protein [candidate division CSSED10-310 bacterium]